MAQIQSHEDIALLYSEHGLSALLPILIAIHVWERSYGPLALPHPIYHFQREGIDFLLKRHPGALLADDMGLGKTVQTIVALRVLFYKARLRTALIVAPKAVLTSWERHFEEWAPELGVKSLMGPPHYRRHQWGLLANGGFQVGIITYESLRNDWANLALPRIGVMVADEVQKIKNPDAKITQAMREIEAEGCWALTGTPLENSLSEFASVLHFVDRRVKDIDYQPGYYNQALVVTVQTWASELMLRRKKGEVLHQLPKLFSNIEYIKLGQEQQRVYDKVKREGISELRSKPRRMTNVLQLIHELKQICNGVQMLGGQLDSTKFDWLLGYLAIAKDAGDKTLVYSQYTNKLPEQIKDKFPLKYQGGMSDYLRQQAITAFSDDPECPAMLLSLRAGGLGLNLQAANRVVHFDSWWNPAVQAQATARVHRLGQTKTVFETTLVTVGTIEEGIQKLLEKKQKLFDLAVDDLSVSGLGRTLTVDEMYGLFGLGSSG